MLAELLPMQRYKKFRYNIIEFDYLNQYVSMNSNTHGKIPSNLLVRKETVYV